MYTILGYTTDILPDNTYHTLDFFYLERGNVDSNMNLRYNLLTVPESNLIKVDQMDDAVAGAVFELYAVDEYRKNGTAATPIATGTTLILVESNVPPGYRSNGDIELYFHTTKADEVTEAEANQDGYQTTTGGTQGNIMEDADAQAMFINEKKDGGDGEVSDPTENLSITKTVTGEGDREKAWTFSVTLKDSTGADLSGSFAYSGSKTGTLTSGGTIQLRHGETVIISGIPAGTQYLVTEADANQDGYQTTVTEAEGIIQEGVLSTAVFINDWSKSTTTPEIPDNQDGSRDPNTPQTGDNSLTGLWGVLCAVFLLGLLLAWMIGKVQQKKRIQK